MITITFQQQYNKIVSAYYKNELDPMDGCACFVGNLLNNDYLWEAIRSCGYDYGDGVLCDNDERISLFYRGHGVTFKDGENFIKVNSHNLYSPEDILDLENNFLKIWHNDGDRTEDSLFKAMESTLEMLKQIHISKGEIIPDYNFTKRVLVNE